MFQQESSGRFNVLLRHEKGSLKTCSQFSNKAKQIDKTNFNWGEWESEC
jgi:hypothetical protein